MNLQDYFIKYLNKPLDYDGVYGGQCVDVIKGFFKEVLNRNPVSGNAIDYFLIPPPGFTKIYKGLFNRPQPGDLIVWNYPPYGHIAVCNWARRNFLFNDLSVFEQNNPPGSVCHFGIHDYKNILGWLRPSAPVETPSPRPIPKQTPVIFELIYLSDTDDISEQVDYCDAKLKEFSGGLLGVDYAWQKIDSITSKPNYDLEQEVASDIVNSEVLRYPYHGVVLGHYGYSTSPGYCTYTTFVKNILMTQGFKPFPKDILLFELGHQIIIYYNKHRGTNPYIENIDNYTGGEHIVKAKILKVLPYLSVFKL